jgi:hypothetical protein
VHRLNNRIDPIPHPALAYPGMMGEGPQVKLLRVIVWKWEEVSMDFIIRLPPTHKNFDSIWVMVDHLTKSTHFIPVRTDYRPSDYVELYFS